MNKTFTTVYDVWDYVRKTDNTPAVEGQAIRHVDLSMYATKFNGYVMHPYSVDDDGVEYRTRRHEFACVDDLYKFLCDAEDASLVLARAYVLHVFRHKVFTVTVDDMNSDWVDVDPFVESTVVVYFADPASNHN